MSGSSLNDCADFAASTALLGGIPSFATNFTDQSRPVASLRSISSCRRLFALASASIFDLSSGEWPSKKLRPSIPIGRIDSLNVRRNPFTGILARIFCHNSIEYGSSGGAVSGQRGVLWGARAGAGGCEGGDTPPAPEGGVFF